ncbi:hypothetical protein [Candidatus Nephthysia bennettiae]
MRELPASMSRAVGWLRQAERATRPVNKEFVAAMARRWAELPDHVRTPAQALGRHAVGCEGTHGVFPRCNLVCTPCYHSRDANRVRVDGPHTLREVEAQMGLLRRLRGPTAHAQLIGGEVSLLSPDDHAAALMVMRRYGREPMSMTHGDFDYDYLARLALGPDGQPRLGRLSFAAHFDMLMFGRSGLARAASEVELNPFRQRFCAMFARLRREHRVRSFLAHNMTVTPTNLHQIAGVIRDCHDMGFSMFSFQPAAFVGDDRRWHEDYRDASGDRVWAEIERGAGAKLDHHLVQHGDLRCNRVAYGFYVGDCWFPLLTDDPCDLAARDAFYRHFGGVIFTGSPLAVVAGRVARVVARHPRVVAIALGWLARTARRVGVRSLLRHRRVRPVSFVMHSFMDAADVAPAWDLLQRGERSDDPRIRATQERLQACHYTMAHPKNGTLVPACVQHSVLDPAENRQLGELLPLPIRQARQTAEP